MSTICIAYAFTCLGFCLGFAAAAIFRGAGQRCDCTTPVATTTPPEAH